MWVRRNGSVEFWFWSCYRFCWRVNRKLTVLNLGSEDLGFPRLLLCFLLNRKCEKVYRVSERTTTVLSNFGMLGTRAKNLQYGASVGTGSDEPTTRHAPEFCLLSSTVLLTSTISLAGRENPDLSIEREKGTQDTDPFTASLGFTVGQSGCEVRSLGILVLEGKRESRGSSWSTNLPIKPPTCSVGCVRLPRDFRLQLFRVFVFFSFVCSHNIRLKVIPEPCVLGSLQISHSWMHE